MFVVAGARDFSPEITVLPIGTEVPCPDIRPDPQPDIACQAKAAIRQRRLVSPAPPNTKPARASLTAPGKFLFN